MVKRGLEETQIRLGTDAPRGKHRHGKEICEIEAREVKSPFWDVVPDGDGFRGENTLGKLLMKLRDELIDSDNESLMVVTPPSHLGLMFLGEVIVTIDRRSHLLKRGTRFSERVAEVRP